MYKRAAVTCKTNGQTGRKKERNNHTARRMLLPAASPCSTTAKKLGQDKPSITHSAQTMSSPISSQPEEVPAHTTAQPVAKFRVSGQRPQPRPREPDKPPRHNTAPRRTKALAKHCALQVLVRAAGGWEEEQGERTKLP